MFPTALDSTLVEWWMAATPADREACLRRWSTGDLVLFIASTSAASISTLGTLASSPARNDEERHEHMAFYRDIERLAQVSLGAQRELSERIPRRE